MIRCVHKLPISAGEYSAGQCRQCWAALNGVLHAMVATVGQGERGESRGVEGRPRNGGVAGGRPAFGGGGGLIRRGVGVPATKVKPLPCVHVGDPAGPRGWHLCDHEDEPLGSVVCGCKGCGVRCPGYTTTRGE